MANIANGLDGAGEIAAQTKVVGAKGSGGLALPDGLPDCLDMMLCPRGLSDELTPALADELPLLARDGGFIRQGYDLALDNLRGLRDESRRLIVTLQSRYVDETRIASLKIKHNNVLGYHIDVRSNHAGKLMDHEIFIHRQTTAQAVRFTTTELAQMERDMASAADRALTLELEIFDRLRSLVLQAAHDLSNAARALAEIDVATAAAQLATANHYCRPQLVAEPVFNITKGRHPVIELILDSQTPFIANDCNLDDGRLWLLTGPNICLLYTSPSPRDVEESRVAA